jgi:beta-galactosidase
MIPYRILPYLLIFFFNISVGFSQSQPVHTERLHILMDDDWRFAFGHPYDTKLDFDNGTSYFSYLAKSAYGDGAAAAGFDDRTWRKLELPHDWAVEQPFEKGASVSHGYKAIGRNFPGTSVGWYRKKFCAQLPGRPLHLDRF